MHNGLNFERLENRQLLTVTVGFQPKQALLTLAGDAGISTVDIEGTGVPGQVDVFVDGVAMGTFSGVRSIKGNLFAGNDTLRLAAVNIGGSVNVKMGFGDDEFDVDNTPDVGASPDGSVYIGGSVFVSFAKQSGDCVTWDCDAGLLGITIQQNVTLTGVADVDLNGGGASFNTEPNDIHIGGFALISLTGLGTAPHVEMDNVNVGGVTTLGGSALADTIEISDSSFFKVNAVLGGGNDVLDLELPAGPNRFGGAVVIDFGAGIDTLDNQAANVFLVSPVVKKGPEVLV